MWEGSSRSRGEAEASSRAGSESSDDDKSEIDPNDPNRMMNVQIRDQQGNVRVARLPLALVAAMLRQQQGDGESLSLEALTAAIGGQAGLGNDSDSDSDE